MSFWKGTPVEDAIHYLLSRNVPVSGTSAGLAIMGEFLFSAKNGTVYSDEGRIVQDGWSAEARGSGSDEETALVVEPNGAAARLGNGAVYFLRPPGRPEVCKSRTPLTYRNVSVYRIAGSATFNLSTWSGNGGAAYTLSAEAGTLTSTQGGGGIY